jgi:hypothetical protein
VKSRENHGKSIGSFANGGIGKQKCPPNQAMCGFKAQIDDSDWDKTGQNNIHVQCCDKNTQRKPNRKKIALGNQPVLWRSSPIPITSGHNLSVVRIKLINPCLALNARNQHKVTRKPCSNAMLCTTRQDSNTDTLQRNFGIIAATVKGLQTDFNKALVNGKLNNRFRGDQSQTDKFELLNLMHYYRITHS